MTKVLHVNHTAVVGGAERSLLSLLDHTDRSRIAGVACPPGPLAEQVLRRDLPWYETTEPEARFDAPASDRVAAMARLAATGPLVESIVRRTGADVLHANSVRTALAVALSRRPLVSHVRDVLPSGATATAVRHVVAARSARVVAISRFVAERFHDDLRRMGRWSVVDNPIDLGRFPTADPGGRPTARLRLGLAADVPLVLVIGQITPWKRQHLAIEALEACRRDGTRVQLAIVGSVKFTEGRTGETNRAYEAALRDSVRRRGLDDVVMFTGETDDVAGHLAAADAVLVPSTDEPFGRAAAEAIATGVPVLSSAGGGPAEVIARLGGGVVEGSDDPAAWGTQLRRLLAGAAVVETATATRVRATFDAARHGVAMARMFDDVAKRSARR